MNARIALIGDFNPEVTAHQAIPKALQLASKLLREPIEHIWVGTSGLGRDVPQQLTGFAGVWCVPASPYANTDGALDAIRFARETGRPFLGTCGGFQHALLEYVRNVMGYRDAEHAEIRPAGEMLLITPLTCSLIEQSGVIFFSDGSRLQSLYGRAFAEEKYHCRYGLNPQYETLLNHSPLRISARDSNGEVRAIELDEHPFFIATLFQPERRVLKGQSHTLITAFVSAAASFV